MLAIRELRFAHDDGVPLFDGLALTVPAGLVRVDAERGKTTLLRLLAGERRASGRFTLDGAPWTPGDGACLVDPRAAAWDALTPAQLADAVRARHPGFDDAAWQRHLDGFELQPHRTKTMHMLSTGSRRKAALAATLASNARVLLLDEPTAGLDRPALAWLAQALAARSREPGRTALAAAAWGLEDALPWSAVLVF